MAETSNRRKRVFLLFLAAATVGGVIKLFAEPRSAASEVATILLVVWIIPAGWFVVYFAKARRLVTMPVFDARQPFVPHVTVDLTLRQPLGKGHQAIFVVGAQGFTARFMLSAAGPEAETPLRVEAQFLRPDMALPHFPAGGAFSVIEGRSTVGTGEVVRILAAPTGSATAARKQWNH